jgi:hypothetical protein
MRVRRISGPLWKTSGTFACRAKTQEVISRIELGETVTAGPIRRYPFLSALATCSRSVRRPAAFYNEKPTPKHYWYASN